jgi:hypothetical protein
MDCPCCEFPYSPVPALTMVTKTRECIAEGQSPCYSRDGVSDPNWACDDHTCSPDATGLGLNARCTRYSLVETVTIDDAGECNDASFAANKAVVRTHSACDSPSSTLVSSETVTATTESTTLSEPNYCEDFCDDPAFPGLDSEEATTVEVATSENYTYPGRFWKREVTARIRVDHQPTPTCYLKVWLKKTTTELLASDCNTIATETGTPVVDVLEYEWIGEAPAEPAGTKVCLKDPEELPAAPANSVNTGQEVDGVFDITPPAAAEGEGVVVTVEILKYSYLPGYTPNDPDEEGDQGNMPNGLPIPA